MPLRPSERIITIDTSPATITIAIRMNELSPAIANGQTDIIQEYIISGTHTMGGNITIAPNATGVAAGITFKFYYIADVTLGANTFQIFGYSMTAAQLLQNSTITCRYSGSAWSVVLSSSFTEDDIVATNHIIDEAITTAKIAPQAVTTAKIALLNITTGLLADGAVTTVKLGDLQVTTAKIALLNITTGLLADLGVTTGKIAAGAVTNAKLAALTEGSLKIGDASNLVSDLAIGTDTYVLQSNGTTAAWVDPNTLPISNVVRYAEVDIATAAVLTLNSVPVPIVPAQGAGLTIVVIAAGWKMTYAGVAYATNTNLILQTNTATDPQWNDGAALARTTDTYVNTVISGGGATNLVANQPLNVMAQTGDPTLGTSNIKVFCWYVVQES